jgi:hypothetical protein
MIVTPGTIPEDQIRYNLSRSGRPDLFVMLGSKM